MTSRATLLRNAVEITRSRPLRSPEQITRTISFDSPKHNRFFLRRAEKLSTSLGDGGFAPPLYKNFCRRPCIMPKYVHGNITACIFATQAVKELRKVAAQTFFGRNLTVEALGLTLGANPRAQSIFKIRGKQ